MLFRCNILALVGGESWLQHRNESIGRFVMIAHDSRAILQFQQLKLTLSDASRACVGLLRCSAALCCSGGRNPRYSPNKVMIWDDHQNRCIGELSFRTPVLAVRLRRDRIVVVLEYKIYVYDFSQLKLLDHFETSSNMRGLCCLSSLADRCVLVTLGLAKGHIRCELYNDNTTTLIEAHESPVSCMQLSQDGTRLATASERGTLLRIFDTSTGASLQEVLGGLDSALVYSLAFSQQQDWLACIIETLARLESWHRTAANRWV